METTATTPTTSASAPGILRRHRGKFLVAALLLAVALVMAVWTGVTLAFSYSKGDRIGYVQKFSHRGWVCPTWEGELAMSPVPGSQPQIFQFTVRDGELAKRITTEEGKKVALHYEEKRGLPSSCFGDTNYFVIDVRILGP